MTYSGIYVGEVIGFSLSGLLVNSTIMIGGVDCGGWPSLFYVFGMLGVLWFPVWMYLSCETPCAHPRISADEIVLLRKGKAGSSRASSSSFSLGAYESLESVEAFPADISGSDNRAPVAFDITDKSESSSLPAFTR